jgi:two-component sensor histidine kinase
VNKPHTFQSQTTLEELLLRELTHRMNNELASAIAVVGLAASRAKNDEAKGILSSVVARLHCYARINRFLELPSHDTRINATLQLEQLCKSISQSRLDCKGIELVFSGAPVWMSAERCWRLSMIISELITNSERHAFVEYGGTITVELVQLGSFARCRVADNGAGRAQVRPGRGTTIVKALAASLGGMITQWSESHGTIIDVVFPANINERVTNLRPLL